MLETVVVAVICTFSLIGVFYVDALRTVYTDPEHSLERSLSGLFGLAPFMLVVAVFVGFVIGEKIHQKCEKLREGLDEEG